MVETRNKKGIIFDWGGVIFRDGFAEALKHYAEINNLTYKEFHDLIHGVDEKSSENLWWKFSTGRISEKEYWTKMRKYLRNTRVILNIKNWNYHYSVPISGTVDVIRSLKDRYLLGMLTNHTKEWFDYFDSSSSANRIHSMFDIVIDSSKLGIKKPDKRIYEIALERMEAYPDEVIFIDDKEKNTEAAKMMGIDSIIFTDSRQLRKDLALRGILV